MRIYLPAFISYLVFCLGSCPVFALAQHSGNTCAVSKSPFRISMDSGKVIYSIHCTSCHQADGLGQSGVNPPLNVASISGDKKKLVEILIKGQSHQEINGVVYQIPMPPGPDLKDQEIADLLTYIRNSFGNHASKIKASEVKSIRSTLK